MPAPIALLVHVSRPDWARHIETHFEKLVAPVMTEAALGSVLLPNVISDRRAIAQFIMELVHRAEPTPIVLISDALFEAGQPSHFLKVVRSVCLSHGRLSSFISLDANAVSSSQPFLHHLDFGTPCANRLRNAIETAAVRLELLGAPDQGFSTPSRPPRYTVRAVADQDMLRDCFALRHRIYRHIGYLENAVAESQSALDIDYHDGMSLHLAAVDSDTGALAGTARVVIPHRVVHELREVRREFSDILAEQKQWTTAIAKTELEPRLRDRVELPGCAPLPMLTYVQNETNYSELLSKAAVGAELSRFVVDPRYRGDGVSRLLAHVALASALELEREMLFLECLPHFGYMYKKYGFVEINERSAVLDGDTMSLLYDSMVCPLKGTSRFIESLRWDAELLYMMTAPAQSAQGSDELPAPVKSPALAPVPVTAPMPISIPVGALFDCSVPSYVLDRSYRIVDWNPTFYHLFARPHGLRRGMHVTVFLTALANVEEVTARSLEVFAPGKNPLTDSELLLIRHPVYGVVESFKHASQLLGPGGEAAGWLVSFHISNWEHREKPLLEDMMAALATELAWEQVAHAAQPLFRAAAFEPVLAQVTKNLAANDDVLLLGLGPADFPSALLATGAHLTIQDHNQRLLDRVPADATVQIVKAEATDLDSYPAGRFQRIIIPWSRLRGAEWPSFAALRRVLKSGGECFLIVPDHAGIGSVLEELARDSGADVGVNARHSAESLVENARELTTDRALATLADSGFTTFQEEPTLNDRIFVLRLQEPIRRHTPVPLLQRHRHS